MDALQAGPHQPSRGICTDNTGRDQKSGTNAGGCLARSGGTDSLRGSPGVHKHAQPLCWRMHRKECRP
eukprot:504250-Pelagomonas_calceolata.AAC.4